MGENLAFVSTPKFSGIILDFIKKVMLIFGCSESPWTNYWWDVLCTGKFACNNLLLYRKQTCKTNLLKGPQAWDSQNKFKKITANQN